MRRPVRGGDLMRSTTAADHSGPIVRTVSDRKSKYRHDLHRAGVAATS
jgi:hypothetical protein